MPATEMSPHGLLIAPARVQLARVRSLAGRANGHHVQYANRFGHFALDAHIFI